MGATMILINALVDTLILAGVAGLVLWARRRSRNARKDHRTVVEELGGLQDNHRAVVREIGRLRMHERDSQELSRMLHEIRRHLAVQTEARYLAGVKERAREGGRPQHLRALD